MLLWNLLCFRAHVSLNILFITKQTIMASGMEGHISQRLASELATLFYYHPPCKLSRNLRNVFLDYVECGLTVGVPDYFEELAPELNWLFNFLDVAVEEVTYTDEKRTGPGPALMSRQPVN